MIPPENWSKQIAAAMLINRGLPPPPRLPCPGRLRPAGVSFSRSTMARWLFLLVLLVPALARPQSADCDFIVDMALVARALAEEKIEKERIVRVLAHIYLARPTALQAMAEEASISTLPAAAFAGVFRSECERLNRQPQRQLFRGKTT